MQREQKCGNCVHWYSTPEPGEGQCRANPPQLVVLTGIEQRPVLNRGQMVAKQPQMTNRVQSMFPPMLAEDPGCSRYEEDHENKAG